MKRFACVVVLFAAVAVAVAKPGFPKFEGWTNSSLGTTVQRVLRLESSDDSVEDALFRFLEFAHERGRTRLVGHLCTRLAREFAQDFNVALAQKLVHAGNRLAKRAEAPDLHYLAPGAAAFLSVGDELSAETRKRLAFEGRVPELRDLWLMRLEGLHTAFRVTSNPRENGQIAAILWRSTNVLFPRDRSHGVFHFDARSEAEAFEAMRDRVHSNLVAGHDVFPNITRWNAGLVRDLVAWAPLPRPLIEAMLAQWRGGSAFTSIEEMFYVLVPLASAARRQCDQGRCTLRNELVPFLEDVRSKSGQQRAMLVGVVLNLFESNGDFNILPEVAGFDRRGLWQRVRKDWLTLATESDGGNGVGAPTPVDMIAEFRREQALAQPTDERESCAPALATPRGERRLRWLSPRTWF